MTNSQNSGSFPPRKHSWECTQGSAAPSDPFDTQSKVSSPRVGTFDAFLPCELGRRREATLVSAVGPFCAASGEDRASGYQTKIPFLVAATNTTAASATTERQAHRQIAASSESDFGMCVTRGVSSWVHHYQSLPRMHAKSLRQVATKTPCWKSLRLLAMGLSGFPDSQKSYPRISQRRRFITLPASVNAPVTTGARGRLTLLREPSSSSCTARPDGLSWLTSCGAAKRIGGWPQSATTSLQRLRSHSSNNSICWTLGGEAA
jgi:hypothetical protein